ncbi:hypothetical protein WJ968_35505 [Achromobacter xylosoxidans]
MSTAWARCGVSGLRATSSAWALSAASGVRSSWAALARNSRSRSTVARWRSSSWLIESMNGRSSYGMPASGTNV